MSDLRLVVNGLKYGGWKSIRVTTSIESLAGSFELEASDRWGGQDEIWPIFEEDACRVEIDDESVIEGYVDQRNVALSATSRTLSYSGRDRAGALVDNSAILKSWTFGNASIVDIAKKLAAPFGIPVSVQPGLVLKPQEQLAVHPGDKAFEALKRAASVANVLIVSDGAGGIVITRAGTARVATALVEGENLLGISVKYDGTDRYHKYVIVTQAAGTDFISGKAIAAVRAEATDVGVRRLDRVLLIQPDHGMGQELARRRADWEARVRAAKATTVTALVRGWRQPSGPLWPLNALISVRAPSVGIDGDLLISEVESSIGEGGQVAQLRLVRPDAFLPEPKAVVKGEGAWKELRKGV